MLHWTPEHLKEAAKRYGAIVGPGGFSKDGLAAVMSYAMELAAARLDDDGALEALIREHVGPTDGRDAEAVRRAFHAQGATVATLQAKVEEIEKAHDRTREHLLDKEDECKSLRADRDRYRVERDAINAECARVSAEGTKEAEALRAEVERLKARVRVLEGDAPQEANTPKPQSPFGDAGDPDVVLLCMNCRGDHPHRWYVAGSEQGEGWRCSSCGEPSSEGRHPCSPTCTHDDAANPGHPERVKALSAEVIAMAGVDPLAEKAKQAGAQNGREVASFKVGHENGAEAMRAACLEAALASVKRSLGVVDGDPALVALKAAIKGATP